jgi:hypothetical protein
MQTVKFATFPFTHKGFNFVSRISETCDQLPLIMLIGEEFIEMNRNAIDDLLNIDETTTLAELEKALSIINEGATQMFLELAGE